MTKKWPCEFPGAYWLDKTEERAVLDVLRNGSLFRYYGLGKPKYVDRMEKACGEFYGVKYALAVNSGTGALITSLRALGIGPGCEVILPAFLWVASVAAVVQVGAIPVLSEIDDSFCMDPGDLEKKITSRTKLVIPIHMAGAPCDMTAIMRVARKHRIRVLEDCAQCNGGTVRGRMVGTFGDMGIFSLQLNKNMTCGEGGIIITNTKRLYDRAFSAHDMGLIRVRGRLAAPEPYALMWGGGRRMTELSGAVAWVQLKKMPKIIAHMRASKKRIKKMIEHTPGFSFRRLNDECGDTGPFLVLILPDENTAKRATKKLRQCGLHNACRIAEYGLHIYYNILSLVQKVPLSGSGDPWSLPENARLVSNYGKGACPRSDELFARSILVPIPSKLTRKQEDHAGNLIRNAVTA